MLFALNFILIAIDRAMPASSGPVLQGSFFSIPFTFNFSESLYLRDIEF